MALQETFEKQGNWLFKRRGVLPIFVLVVGLGIYLLTLEMQGMMFSALAPYWIYYEFFCLLVSLLGVFVRVYTVGHTPANTSGRNTEKQVADSLNKTGIYSTVRHPLYLGNFLMYFGIALLTCNIAFILMFILIFWLYYERIMYAEEQFLRRKFSEEYLAWSEHVPAFFPKFKGFVKPSLPFSWKKVLKKEKNGVFFLFLIFCIFNLCGWPAIHPSELGHNSTGNLHRTFLHSPEDSQDEDESARRGRKIITCRTYRLSGKRPTPF